MSVSHTASKSQSLCEDVFNFWNVGLIVLNMWAYKDVAVRCMALLDSSSTKTFFSEDWDEVGECVVYFAKLSVIALAINVFAAFKNVCLHYYLNTLPEGPKGRGGFFAKKSLRECPMSLGVGIVYYKISNIVLYIPLTSWFPTSVIKVAEAAILCLSSLITTRCLISIMYWYQQRIKRLGIDPNVLNRSTADMAKEEPLRMFVKSMKFVYAWCWANVGYFLVFRVGWTCNPLSAVCPGQVQTQFFAQLYYAVGLTMACKSAIPGMKAAAAMMTKLNSHVVEAFLVDDARFLEDQKISDQLMSAFCGIAIGWAWTNIAVTECASKISATCPADPSILKFFYWFITLCVYFFIAICIYHSMMETHRLANRCRKIVSIEDGNGHRLFSGIDQHDDDGDGMLNKEELVNYIEAEGLNSAPFVQAAAQVDAREENPDGEVSREELMGELEGLIAQIKAGKYDQSKALDFSAGAKNGDGGAVALSGISTEMKGPLPSKPTTPRTKPGKLNERLQAARPGASPPQMGHVLKL